MFYNEIITESYDGDASITGEYITSVVTEMLTEHMNLREMMFKFDMAEVRAIQENSSIEILYEGTGVIDKIKAGYAKMVEMFKELFAKFKAWLNKNKVESGDICKMAEPKLKDKNLSKFSTVCHEDYDFSIVDDLLNIISIDTLSSDIEKLAIMRDDTTKFDKQFLAELVKKYDDLANTMNDTLDRKLSARGLSVETNSRLAYSLRLDKVIRGKFGMGNPDYKKLIADLSEYGKQSATLKEYNEIFNKLEKSYKETKKESKVVNADTLATHLAAYNIIGQISVYVYNTIGISLRVHQSMKEEHTRILHEMIMFKG